MKFKKGQSGNPAGRPKGSKDKATAELRERVSLLLGDQFDTGIDKLNELEPKEYINAYIRLMEYALPKLNRTSISGPEGGPVFVNRPVWMTAADCIL